MKENLKRKKGEVETQFKVKVDLKNIEAGEKSPPIKAYLFSPSGEILDAQKVSDRGLAVLKTDYGFGEQLKFKVTVGPEVEKATMLSRAKARSVSVVAKIGKAVDVAISVYRPDWGCWFGTRYDIVGDVKKRIKAGSDTTICAPVCTSIVEIYEVDYIGFITKLPDDYLERFRDKLQRIPEPIPEPPWPYVKEKLPIPRPGPVISGVISRSLAPEAAKATATSASGVMSEQLSSQISMTAVKNLPTESFRNYVIANLEVLRPYICLYLAGSYPKTLVAMANTDANGHFSTSITLYCTSEQPDLYFKVRQCISGSLTYVYAPTPVPCHTFWNHPSGKEVHLVVTDARARCHFENPSVDKSGIYVMPIGIGNDGWWKIHQGHFKPFTLSPYSTTTLAAAPTPEVQQLGGLSANRGLYHPAPDSTFDPYGKTLDLIMQFHDGLRDPSGPNVMYYRWSYKKEGTSDWINIDTPIVHRYLDQTDPLHPKIKTYKLGPNPNPNPASSEDNLFEVPPPDLDWYVEHDRHDRPFAKWDTTTLSDGNPAEAAGKYTLKLEMFDANGNKVTPADAGFKFFIVQGDLENDEWPVDDSPHVQTDGSILFNVHVDNNDTVAEIESVGFVGTTPQECQFLEYTDLSQAIEVKYQAYHPNGFLSHYNLTINRGMSGTQESPNDWINVTDPAGPPATTPVAEGLTGVTVEDLLDTYSRCAFAVRLHTYPRTRDGYDRIREYEASDVAAFALVEQ